MAIPLSWRAAFGGRSNPEMSPRGVYRRNNLRQRLGYIGFLLDSQGIASSLASRVRSLERDSKQAAATIQELEREKKQAAATIEALERDSKQAAAAIEAFERAEKQAAATIQELEREKRQATLTVQGLEREVGELGAVIVLASEKVSEMLKDGASADVSQPQAVDAPIESKGFEQLKESSADPKTETKWRSSSAFRFD